MEEVKMLPYGIADFADLRNKNRYCVDKTMYLPRLEAAGDFLFLIRPRRFGKSIFLSMLRDYYDTSRQ
ncbi:MAG: AAA family ATPase, partial [Bacteroides sp.]|nr:AAA family ATPase [Bacteroides sp.]